MAMSGNPERRAMPGTAIAGTLWRALGRLPIIPDSAQPRMKLVGRKQRATAQELARNPRARSALLRVAEKLA